MSIKILEALTKSPDGIYSADNWGSGQEAEIAMRKLVADRVPSDLDQVIATHHSFPVMDHEVALFVQNLPRDALILDVGGCWGWHWRKIWQIRSDVKIVIMDFVRENLIKASYFLGEQIGKSVYLVHGDGTKIPFPDNTFDAYWAVQTLQHIPALEHALLEANRVLKPGGKFSMYNLNNPLAIKLIYKLLGRTWIDEGVVDGMFFLRRSSKRDALLIKKIFGNVSAPKYTEILFTPELNLHGPANLTSRMGRFDAKLTSRIPFFALIARQKSYDAIKGGV